jgi:hypothetical protein
MAFDGIAVTLHLFLFEHDLIGKAASTFPDRALDGTNDVALTTRLAA